MAEWLIAPVLKTGIVLYSELSRVRIPLSPFVHSIELFSYFISFAWFFKIIKRMARLSHLAEPEKKKLNYIKVEKKKDVIQLIPTLKHCIFCLN